MRGKYFDHSEDISVKALAFPRRLKKALARLATAARLSSSGSHSSQFNLPWAAAEAAHWPGTGASPDIVVGVEKKRDWHRPLAQRTGNCVALSEHSQHGQELERCTWGQQAADKEELVT